MSYNRGFKKKNKIRRGLRWGASADTAKMVNAEALEEYSGKRGMRWGGGGGGGSVDTPDTQYYYFLGAIDIPGTLRCPVQLQIC